MMLAHAACSAHAPATPPSLPTHVLDVPGQRWVEVEACTESGAGCRCFTRLQRYNCSARIGCEQK
eukprot:4017215-Alexandrium_andersonii.AAC.1